MPITKNTPTSEIIHDFVHSDDPKFDKDSIKQRIKRALGAAYSLKKEEVELNEHTSTSRYGDGGPYGKQISQDTESAYKEFGTILKGKGYTKSKYSGKQSAQEEHRYEHPNGHTVSFGGWHGTGTGNRDYGGIKMCHYVHDKSHGHTPVHEFMPDDKHEVQHGNGKSTITKAGYDAHKAHLAKVKSHLLSIGKPQLPGVRKEEVELNEAIDPIHAKLKSLGYKKDSSESTPSRTKTWYKHPLGQHPHSAEDLADHLGHEVTDSYKKDYQKDYAPGTSEYNRNTPKNTHNSETGVATSHQDHGTLFVEVPKKNKAGKQARMDRSHGLDNDARYESVELEEGPIDYNSFAKKKAAENKERMKKERATKNAFKSYLSGRSKKSSSLPKKLEPSSKSIYKALEDYHGGQFEHYENEPKHIIHTLADGRKCAGFKATVTHSYTHKDLGMKPEEMKDTAETYHVKVIKHPDLGIQIHHLSRQQMHEETELNEKYITEANQIDIDLHIMFTKQMIEKQKKTGRSVKALEDKLNRMIAARKVNKRNAMREEVDLNESAYKPGTKVTVDGKNGEISYVKHSNDPEYPHNYKILDTDAKDPYKQKHLENGHYIPHTRVKLAEEVKLEESDVQYMSKYKKGNEKFSLWRKGNYWYELTHSSQGGNGFKHVKDWHNKSHEEIHDELVKNGHSLLEEIELEEATYVVKHDGVESEHPDTDVRKLFAGKSNIINHVTKYETSARKTKKLLDSKGFKNVRIEKNGKLLEGWGADTYDSYQGGYAVHKQGSTHHVYHSSNMPKDDRDIKDHLPKSTKLGTTHDLTSAINLIKKHRSSLQ